MSSKLLIVEDDITLQKVLKSFLQDEGFLIDTASTGSEALIKVEKAAPNLVLLDLGLPDIQGETVLSKIRESYPDVAVVILTAKSQPQEIAAGLNLGADDYLPKPFAAEELLARIRARMTKNGASPNNIQLSDLTLDLGKMAVKRGDKNIDLTKTEYELLTYLLKNKGRVLSREMILNHVWGYSPGVESRAVDIYIGYLRKKIDNGFSNKLIKNKRGFGYYIGDD